MPIYTKTATGKIRGRLGGTLRLSADPVAADLDFVQGESLFTASFENAGAVPTWEDQEFSFGQEFAPGDVPTGYRVRVVVDGKPIPCQFSNRTSWADGSLKVAQVRARLPVIPVGATKPVIWEKVSGDWSGHDRVLHDSPVAITSKVSIEYNFTSWKGRDAANVLTAERGPKRFRSSDMLSLAANNAWVETVMVGPLCCEWRATDMATLTGGGKDSNFGAVLYARAWGGTNGNPKRIQFFYRTVYGWSTDVAADEQGIQVSAEVRVNGVPIRGVPLGTTSWIDVKGWKGGFFASCGPEGRMDWFDVQTGAVVTPPVIVYRRNVDYGIKARFIPPVDTTNSAFPMTPSASTYAPGKRGPLRAIQDDVADHAMLAWTGSKPMFWNIAAHARASAAQIAGHQQYARSAALGMGAMTSIALHRTTRKIVSYLPPSKQTNENVLGTSIYGSGKPAEAAANLRTEITNLDSAHFPQMAFWPALTEGDQHWLDLAYHEATLPGAFETSDYGFHGSSVVTGMGTVPFGGISYRGQIRAVGHCARPIGNAVGLGNPSDPHWVMCRDYLDHWCEMTERVVFEEDAWRGGISRTDGRRFQDLKALVPNNEPTYKVWMHTIGLGGMAYNYGISEFARLKSRAEWFSYLPTVLGGGYHDDADLLMKPDPIEAVGYQVHCMDGLTAATPYPNTAGSPTTTVEYRRYWKFGQWSGVITDCTYKADGQTVDFLTPAYGSATMLDGMVITPSSVRSGTEPHWGSSASMPPLGLTPGTVYYSVQSSGTTAKLSLTVGGSPVTFTTSGGVDQAGDIFRRPVYGVHPMKLGTEVSSDANAYIVQVLSSLDMVQHYVSPDDLRLLMARQKIFNLKNTSNAPNAWDERGKTTVSRLSPQFTNQFSSAFQ